jgi:hypothetical protein
VSEPATVVPREDEVECLRAALAGERARAEALAREVGGVRAALVQSESDLRALRADLVYAEQRVGLRWLGWAVRGAGRRLRRLLGG